MNIDSFEIEHEDVNKVIIEMLLMISARQLALQQFMLEDKSERTGGSFESLKSFFDDSTAFHKSQIFANLFETFSSIKDVLPPDKNGE